ncbi:MAG: hypothetical protein V4690_02045 [Patescibacteria group bacterium]
MRAGFSVRVLASFDRFLTNLTGHTISSGPTPGGGEAVEYRTGIGRKMIILDEHNRIQILGNSMWVTHYYDQNQNLVRRVLARKNLKPGWKVIYGHKKAYAAYDTYGPKYSPTGGLMN